MPGIQYPILNLRKDNECMFQKNGKSYLNLKHRLVD